MKKIKKSNYINNKFNINIFIIEFWKGIITIGNILKIIIFINLLLGK